MPLNPNTVALLRRMNTMPLATYEPGETVIAASALLRRMNTMPLATYEPGETVIAAGTKTGRLLILKKGAVTIRKNGTVIAEVTEPGAVLGELSALLNQPHTADVQTLKTSEFRVAHADLLLEDPVVLLYVAAILAQRLNLAHEALIDLKSEVSRQRVASV
jgi:CRP-like cAMP-binding protein